MEHPRTNTPLQRPAPSHSNSSPEHHLRRDSQSHSSDTAYYGAAGFDDALNVPDIRLDDYQDPRYSQSSALSPTKEGIGSRLFNSNTAAALTRSSSVLHSRAKSWTNYVSKLNTGTNNQTSAPTNNKAQNRQSKIFGDLFLGESAPVHLGVPTSPTKEESEFVMEYKSGFTERPSTRQHQRQASAQISAPPAPASKGGKLSWFQRKASSPVPAPPTVDTSKDEILNMNLNSSLFPHGPADPLSPQAFNDLLLNATSLLQRMQSAYKEKVDYIASMQPEMDAQKEEVEEAKTRSEHLKMQLEDIGRQHQEQKQANQELIHAISEQKMQLQEAREQGKTIRVVQDDNNHQIDEDELRRRRKRGSAGSDSGFESDTETSSLFSAGFETPVSHRQPNILLTTPDNASFKSQQSSKRNGGNAGGDANLRAENEALRMQIELMTAQFQGAIDLIEGVRAN